MDNEFDKNITKEWPCTTNTLYNENPLIGRLHQYFWFILKLFLVRRECLKSVWVNCLTISPLPAWLPCFKCRNASHGKGSSLDWQFWHLIKSWEQIRRTYTVSITFSFRKQIHCFCRYYLYWLWNLHILSGFCISIFIWNNKEITECILLCMFLCKDWLFQICE